MRILVIEDGRITETGAHRDLLKQSGHYYRLYTQQFRRELVDQFSEACESTGVSQAAQLSMMMRDFIDMQNQKKG